MTRVFFKVDNVVFTEMAMAKTYAEETDSCVEQIYEEELNVDDDLILALDYDKAKAEKAEKMAQECARRKALHEAKMAMA